MYQENPEESQNFMMSRRLNKTIFTSYFTQCLARHLDLMISDIKFSFSFILTCIYI